MLPESALGVRVGNRAKTKGRLHARGVRKLQEKEKNSPSSWGLRWKRDKITAKSPDLFERGNRKVGFNLKKYERTTSPSPKDLAFP